MVTHGEDHPIPSSRHHPPSSTGGSGEAGRGPRAGVQPCPQRRRVLLVEDDAASRELVARVLQRHPDVELIQAGTGTAALEAAFADPPTLVLLNSNLPDLHGSEVLGRLRSEAATHGVPVVVLSADAFRDQVEAMRAAGAVDYLTKPVSIAALIDVVERFA